MHTHTASVTHLKELQTCKKKLCKTLLNINGSRPETLLKYFQWTLDKQCKWRHIQVQWAFIFSLQNLGPVITRLFFELFVLGTQSIQLSHGQASESEREKAAMNWQTDEYKLHPRNQGVCRMGWLLCGTHGGTAQTLWAWNQATSETAYFLLIHLSVLRRRSRG